MSRLRLDKTNFVQGLHEILLSLDSRTHGLRDIIRCAHCGDESSLGRLRSFSACASAL
jgi:hypothetical protein